jgi:hypothetical protein
MAMSKVSEALARPTRTGTQFGAAEILVQFVEAFLRDLNEAQHVALVGVLTLVVGTIQVLIENKTGVGFLRQVPPTEVPVIDPPADGPED